MTEQTLNFNTQRAHVRCGMPTYEVNEKCVESKPVYYRVVCHGCVHTNKINYDVR